MSYLDNIIENKVRDFTLTERHTTDILKPVSASQLVNTIKNPFTGQVYNGLLLTGCFAEMDIVNNNSRFYTEDNYIQFVEDMKQRILETNGIFGTLEHPENYATNAKEISHKVVDIWYDKQLKKVFGTILVLNTPNGLIVKEVYESGSWLSISARGGGKEIDQPNGTKKSVLQIMVTFDIVTHPGFSNAAMDKIIDKDKLSDGEFTVLNENVIPNQDFYSIITYADNNEIVETEKLFESNIYLFEAKRLTKEEKAEELSDEEKLQKNQSSNKNSVENNLQVAVQSQLKESSQELKKRIGSGAGAYYDNSAGFKTQGLNGISKQGQVGLISQSNKQHKDFQNLLIQSQQQFEDDLNEGFIDGAKHIGKEALKGAAKGGSSANKTANKNAKNYHGSIDKKDASK